MSHGAVFLLSFLRRTSVAVLVALLTVLTAASSLPAAASSDALSDAQLRERQRRLDAEQDGLSGQLDRSEDTRARLSRSLAEATARVDQLTGELNRLRNEREQLAAEVAQLETRAASTHDDLARRVGALYRGAASNEFIGLLGSMSADDATARSHYLVAMTRHDRTELETAGAMRVRLGQRRSDLEDATARQDAVAKRARVAQDELDERLTEADAAAQGVRGELAELGDERRRIAGELDRRAQTRQVATRAAQERAAEEQAVVSGGRDIAATSRSLPRRAPETEPPPAPASTPESSGGGGGTACPQDHPRSFTDTWGAPRSGGRSHQGTDVFGARGGNVFAITAGTIEWTRSGSSAGLWLSLRGDNGDRYWYMHLQGFVASAGQRVAAGQHIAYNGDTGNARGTSPHIHFELHPGGGRPVNPYPLLRRACG